MMNFAIRSAQADDYKCIAEVYNSNRVFLLNHLGMECVDVQFVAREVESMNQIGFRSSVIADQETSEIQGVLDYRSGSEVYLSLLMLAADQQRKGNGSRVYASFEQQMRRMGSTSVRVDVVNDYSGNMVPFWRKLGFVEGESVVLNWGKKKSSAVVMRKRIAGE